MLPSPVRGIRAAFVFLTRLPVGGFPYREADLVWASAHFPLVGAALGLLLGALATLLIPPLGATVAALVVLAVSLLLTGAFHEDGLADTADALGGAFERERILTILKDSRVGTFGAAALMLSLALRAALLARLDAAMPVALVLTQCVARTSPVWLSWALPYQTPDATSKSRLLGRARGTQALLATVWSTLVVFGSVYLGLLGLTRALALFAAAAVVALLLGWRFRARLGGVTGDFLGALEQVTEVALLVVLAWP